MKNLKKRSLVLTVVGSMFVSNGAFAIQSKDVTRIENAYNSRESYVRNIEIQDLPNISKNIANLFSYNPKVNIKTVRVLKSKDKDNRYDIEIKFRETLEEYNQTKKVASRLAAETIDMDLVDTAMYLTQAISLMTEYNHDDIEDPLNYSPYGVVRGKAVCQGYTYLLEMVLKERGIKSNKNYVKLNGNLHIYNTLNIDGNNYGVDITNADIGEGGKVDWNYVLFNKGISKGDKEGNNKFEAVKTIAPLSTLEYPIPRVQGLVSIKDSKIYTDTEKGLMGYNYKTNEIAFEFPKEYYEDFYVIGDDLIILTSGGDLINKGQKILATNVSIEDITYNQSSIYVNGEMKYRSTKLPKDKSIKVNKQFKINLDKRYTQQELWEGLSIFEGNKFIIEFMGR